MNAPQHPPSVGRTPEEGLSAAQIAGISITIVVVLIVSTFFAARWMVPPDRPPNIARQAEMYLRQRKGGPLSSSLEKLLTDPNIYLKASDKHALIGKAAPDFTLSDHLQKEWNLDDRLKQGPVVLVFYYGYWCDHCVAQLFGIHEDIERFRELNATVLAISADSPDITKERFDQYGAFAFPTLADPDLKVTERYDCTTTDDTGKKVALHGTFVIDQDGSVRWANVGHRPFLGNATLLYQLAKAQGRLPEVSPDGDSNLQ